MDIISHAAWGGTVIRKKPIVWWAFLFGALPDILGSGPAFLYILFTEGKFWPANAWQLLPDILKSGYSFWHSLFGAGIVFLILALFWKTSKILILPYLLHIAMDLYTHISDPLSRLFFPLVSYDVSRETGSNWWENPWITWINWILIIGINIGIWLYRRNKKINGL